MIFATGYFTCSGCSFNGNPFAIVPSWGNFAENQKYKYFWPILFSHGGILKILFLLKQPVIVIYLRINICEVELWKKQVHAMWQNWVLCDHRNYITSRCLRFLSCRIGITNACAWFKCNMYLKHLGHNWQSVLFPSPLGPPDGLQGTHHRKHPLSVPRPILGVSRGSLYLILATVFRRALQRHLTLKAKEV